MCEVIIDEDPEGCLEDDEVNAESGADVETEDAEGLLAESLAVAGDALVESTVMLFCAANLLAMVRFLASALALAACERIARLASLSIPDCEPAWKETNAFGVGLFVRERGSPSSSVGDARGLLDTDRDARPFRIPLGCVGLDILGGVGSCQMFVRLLARHLLQPLNKSTE